MGGLKLKLQAIPSFVESVTKQLSVDLLRLYNMGFRRFAVTDKGPSGCLPVIVAKNFYSNLAKPFPKLSLATLLQALIELCYFFLINASNGNWKYAF